jgi:hypothetical protein
MIAFGIGFALWCIALILVKHEHDDLSKDSSWGLVLFMAVCTAYVFWGIGWALAWIADVIKLAVL